MTSLVFGGLCLYFSWSVLRLPPERFRQELDQLTGKGHGNAYYRALRGLFGLLGLLGAAMIVLRFVD